MTTVQIDATKYLDAAKYHTMQANEAQRRYEAWHMSLKWLGTLKTMYRKSDKPTLITRIYDEFKAVAIIQMKRLREYENRQRVLSDQAMQAWERS